MCSCHVGSCPSLAGLCNRDDGSRLKEGGRGIRGICDARGQRGLPSVAAVFGVRPLPPWYRELEQIIPGIPPPVPSSDTMAQRLAGEPQSLVVQYCGVVAEAAEHWRYGSTIVRMLAMCGICAWAVQAAGVLASPTSDTAGGDERCKPGEIMRLSVLKGTFF